MPEVLTKDIYWDSCTVCGKSQFFEKHKVAIRETYRCAECKAMLREREQARAILLFFGEANVRSISELNQCNYFINQRIYEPGTSGAIRKYLNLLPKYHQSDYYDDEASKKETELIPHQTLESLTYADASFDLVLTSDILEHVRDPLKAFSEIARVLRVGGFHIFTIPILMPIPAKSVARVKTIDGLDVPILPFHYHGNGKGGQSLVFTDFGMDIIVSLSKTGFGTYFLQAQTQSELANRVVTVVCKRLI